MISLDLFTILYRIPGLLLGFALHELGHAIVADRLGDPTPRNQGKLNLSPKAHIDPVGFILACIIGIGWAKPVQTNPRYLKNYKRDSILISLAGPCMNFILAFFFAVLFKIFLMFNSFGLPPETMKLFSKAVEINLMLFVFNLFPIPGLDGFHILSQIVPFRHSKILYDMERYSMLIFIAIILFGGFLVSFPISVITSIFAFILNI